jgi:hypothetical protein
MTLDEARQIVVEGLNDAAYKETDSSLYDFRHDKNRLFGSEHYNSGHHEDKPSPYATRYRLLSIAGLDVPSRALAHTRQNQHRVERDRHQGEIYGPAVRHR